MDNENRSTQRCVEAVLLDLDGTLLETGFEELMPLYFDGLAARFSDYMPHDVFLQHLMAATEAMMANTDPSITNITVFSQDFFSRTDLDPSLIHRFEEYYRDDFPTLGRKARVDPWAAKVVEAALDRGLAVVIATNPLFPSEAIYERLRWGRLETYPYALVTTGDNMASCKPQTDYYREICSRIGKSPDVCMMVGDDPVMDGPAAAVGMDLFLLHQDGTLADVHRQLTTGSRNMTSFLGGETST